MRTTINLFRLFVLLTTAVVFSATAFTQDGKPVEGQPQEVQRPAANQPHDVRANFLRQLGLSRGQIQQIRKLNIERKPVMEEAQRRSREANRALDEAIYADNASDTDVAAGLKDVQVAQAEVARIRSMNELAVRRILTSEQLLRFRDLRERFEQARQNGENRRAAERQTPAINDKTPSDRQQLQIRRLIRQNQQKPNF
ncbi:MAG: hypothetical protein ABIP78_00400 [Pyrinomonadaceae bacterium]